MSDELKFCDSSLRVNDGIIRCQLPLGHEGEHSASWDWEDAAPLEVSNGEETVRMQITGEASDLKAKTMWWDCEP